MRLRVPRVCDHLRSRKTAGVRASCIVHAARCMSHVACCTLRVDVACRTLHVARCVLMLHATCCMPHVACCTLCDARCTLHVARCVLHVPRCVLHVARNMQRGKARSLFVKWTLPRCRVRPRVLRSQALTIDGSWYTVAGAGAAGVAGFRRRHGGRRSRHVQIRRTHTLARARSRSRACTRASAHVQAHTFTDSLAAATVLSKSG